MPNIFSDAQNSTYHTPKNKLLGESYKYVYDCKDVYKRAVGNKKTGKREPVYLTHLNRESKVNFVNERDRQKYMFNHFVELN